METENDFKKRRVRGIQVTLLFHDNDELFLNGDEAQRFLQGYQRYTRAGIERGIWVRHEFIRFDNICGVETKHITDEEEEIVGCEVIDCLSHIPGNHEPTGCENVPGLPVWGEVSWEWEPTTKTITLYCGYAGSVATAPWKYHADVQRIVVKEEVVLEASAVNLFRNLQNLFEIEGAGKLNTSQVTRMDDMFRNVSSLAELDVSNWATGQVTHMTGIFFGSGLTHLDLSGWDTRKVTWMNTMFSGAISLERLDLSGFDTSSVTQMGSMFQRTKSLRNLTLGKKFRFTRVAGLPAITEEGYTGRWIGEKHGVIYESSLVFMRDYDGGAPDTYIAEKIL